MSTMFVSNSHNHFQSVASGPSSQKDLSIQTHKKFNNDATDIELTNHVNSNQFLSRLACLLHALWGNKQTDKLPSDKNDYTIFHTATLPSVDISHYFLRIAYYSAASTESLIQSLIYLNTLLVNKPTFVINSLNIHRLLLTSITIAAKMHDEDFFNNVSMAKIGGVPLKEMNQMEGEFLNFIQFSLYVQRDTYIEFINSINNYDHNSFESKSPIMKNSFCTCASDPSYTQLAQAVIQRRETLFATQPTTPNKNNNNNNSSQDTNTKIYVNEKNYKSNEKVNNDNVDIVYDSPTSDYDSESVEDYSYGLDHYNTYSKDHHEDLTHHTGFIIHEEAQALYDGSISKHQYFN